MKRFIYSPQVNAYVMTEEYGLVNLSPDIVSGSVTRRLDAVSSASLVLNNKPVRKGGRFEGKYIRTIKPMDRIVIFLTRIHKPTLVFSGYVDDAPFDQLYPGPVTLTASCTLKRLLHTYFDPGLPYMMKYMQSIGGGWLYNPQTGEMQNGPQTTLANLDAQGGIGEILRATLNDIGGWPYSTVHIYRLPPAFIKKAASTFEKEVQATEAHQKEIEDFLKKLMTYEGSFSDPTQAQLNDFEFSSGAIDNNPLPRGLAGEYRAEIYGPSYSIEGFAGALITEAAKEGYQLSAKQAQNAQEIMTQVRGNAFGYGNWPAKSACGFVGTAWAESSLNNDAVNSSSSATGLFQLLSGGFYGSDGYIADVMRDLGKVAGSPALGGPEARNPTYNVLAILRDSIGQSNRTTINNSQYPSWEIQRYFERPEASVLAFSHSYVQKGVKMARAAQRALASAAATKDDSDEAVQGQVGDVKVAPGFFPDDSQPKTGDSLNYTFRIRGNPYNNDKMIFRLAGTNSKLRAGTISIYVPGAKDDSTPQAAAWQNSNVVLESSAGKAQRFSSDDSKVVAKTNASTVGAKLVKPLATTMTSSTEFRTPDAEGAPSNSGGTYHAAKDWFAPGGTNVFAPTDGEVVEVKHSTTNTGQVFGGTVKIQQGNGMVWVFRHVDPQHALQEGSSVKAGDIVARVTNWQSGSPHVHIELWRTLSGGYRFENMLDPVPVLQGGVVPEDTGNNTTGTGSNVFGGTGVALGQEDVAQIAFGVMMGAQLAFPTNSIESVYLQGERALSNDIPLMQWVEFMTKASGRRFQSMPRGDFMAFYPDYFKWAGESPYWRISDIETIDLNISLSDKEIATHVFTTGDTIFNNSVDVWDKLASTVASVESMGSFKDFINIGEDQKLFARKFLQRYGARPMSVERADIKHGMLQYMYGWMTFLEHWSRQYVCQAQFTFMPELYPGGLVEFADKDLVMFVEEVTHTFDLAGGFNTSASLISPSTRHKGGYQHGMVLTQGGLSGAR